MTAPRASDDFDLSFSVYVAGFSGSGLWGSVWKGRSLRLLDSKAVHGLIVATEGRGGTEILKESVGKVSSLSTASAIFIRSANRRLSPIHTVSFACQGSAGFIPERSGFVGSTFIAVSVVFLDSEVIDGSESLPESIGREFWKEVQTNDHISRVLMASATLMPSGISGTSHGWPGFSFEGSVVLDGSTVGSFPGSYGICESLHPVSSMFAPSAKWGSSMTAPRGTDSDRPWAFPYSQDIRTSEMFAHSDFQISSMPLSSEALLLLESPVKSSDLLHITSNVLLNSQVSESLIRLSDQSLPSESFIPSSRFISLQCSFSSNALIRSEMISQAKGPASSQNVAPSPWFSLSLSISKSLSQFWSKVDQTRRFSVSFQFLWSNHIKDIAESHNTGENAEDSRFHPFSSKSLLFSRNLAQSRLCLFLLSIPESLSLLPTDFNGFSLVSFSRRSAQTVYNGALASEGSEARFGRIYVSVGGTIAGLLALIVAITLVIVIHRNRMRTVATGESESGVDIDMTETMSAFEASDRYVSQENTDHVRTGELIRLSFVIE
jgi:hypothetical protein